MKITFCGHSDFIESKEYKYYLLSLFENLQKTNELEFYLGRDGGFDEFSYICAKLHKQKYPQAKIIFVTPYLNKSYNKLIDADNYFDEVIYPEIENVPYKYAIIKRNEWMVDKCDLVIAYAKYTFGGAAKTLQYAKKKGKNIINIAD